MTSLVKKISALAILAIGIPAAALAANADLKMLISPAPVIGITGYSGGGGVIMPTPPQAPATSAGAVSGWTSPNAFVEILSGNRVLGTATAAANGSFHVGVGGATAGMLTVRSTDVSGISTTAPVNLAAGQTATNGVLLPPALTFPTSNYPTGSKITGHGQTIPNSTVSVSLIAANGTTVTQMPVVDAGGGFGFSFSSAKLPVGPFSIQVSVNFNSKTVIATVRGTIGKTVTISPSPGVAVGITAPKPPANANGPEINQNAPPAINSFIPNANNPPPGANVPARPAAPVPSNNLNVALTLAFPAVLVALVIYFIVKALLIFIRKK